MEVMVVDICVVDTVVRGIAVEIIVLGNLRCWHLDLGTPQLFINARTSGNLRADFHGSR